MIMGLKERRAREKQARRRQIIDAARSLLFEKGLPATSINQIAKRAELAVGTIYFYYPSKEDLFAELQEEGLQLLIDRLRQSVSDTDEPGVQLKAMALAYYDFSRGKKDYFDIINYFLSSPQVLLSPDLKQRVDQKTGKILDLIKRVVARGVEKGAFRENDPESCGVLLLSAFHGLMQFRKFEATIFKGASHRDLYCRAVDNLLNGMAAN